jgi:hypothetical protein
MKCAVAAIVLIFLAAGAALAGTQPDGAVIRNTGSTNFTGYTIKVWSDGRVSAVHSNRAGQPVDQAVSATVPKTLTAQFFNDLRTARRARVVAEPCMKSASFGTTTVVQYHGWTSPDLECGGDGHVIALGSDAKKIAAHLRFEGMPVRRIPMLPNEPRRPEPTPTAVQPSGTPEPRPSAS